MKLFIYKTLFLSFVLLILFKITIGSAIQSIEKKIDNYFSKKNVIFLKDKLRKEMHSAIEKENYINKEDAILINKFIAKIKNELKTEQ